jgi:hypothetical protein
LTSGTIFVSDVTATQETAAALANAVNVKPCAIAVRDTSTLVCNVLSSRSGNALVVADRDNLPVVIPRLQAGAAQPLKENEYGRLYVMTLAEGSGTPAVLLHYCDSRLSGGALQTATPVKPFPKSTAKKR